MQRDPLWIEPAIKWKLVTFHEITWKKKYATSSLVLICILQNDIFPFLSVALTRHLTFLTWNFYVSWIFCLAKCSLESKSIQLLRKKIRGWNEQDSIPEYRIRSPSPIPLHHGGFADDWRFDLQVATTLTLNRS